MDKEFEISRVDVALGCVERTETDVDSKQWEGEKRDENGGQRRGNKGGSKEQRFEVQEWRLRRRVRERKEDGMQHEMKTKDSTSSLRHAIGWAIRVEET